MAVQRNINDDITMAYLLQQNQKKAASAGAEEAKSYTDEAVQEASGEIMAEVEGELAPAIEANTLAISKTCHDVIDVTLPNVSSSNLAFAVSGITADHELIQNGFALLSNPSAASGDLTLTTGAGTVTVSGTLTGTTDIQATFCIKETKETGTTAI